MLIFLLNLSLDILIKRYAYKKSCSVLLSCILYRLSVNTSLSMEAGHIGGVLYFAYLSDIIRDSWLVSYIFYDCIFSQYNKNIYIPCYVLRMYWFLSLIVFKLHLFFLFCFQYNWNKVWHFVAFFIRHFKNFVLLLLTL